MLTALGGLAQFEPDLIRTGEDQERAQMQQAQPCPRCGSTNLVPVSDCDTPPTIALACDDCGEIEGDGDTLQDAVTNWNRRIKVTP
jgi:hypothetical protein